MKIPNDRFDHLWHNHPLRPKPKDPTWWSVLREFVLLAICAGVAFPMYVVSNALALVRYVHRDMVRPAE